MKKIVMNEILWYMYIFVLMIADAVKAGKLDENMVRERVKPLFYTRMRLGEFDPPAMNPYMRLNLSVIQSQQHQDLAVWSAAKTFTLLKRPIKMTRPPIEVGVNERIAVGGIIFLKSIYS